MNAHRDELERLLGDDLHRQVDGMVDVPFGLGDVKGRAGRIRRNRRIAAGVGVAAALAVIVPTAVTGGGLLQGTQEIEPAPSPSRSASPSPSPDAPVEAARTTLTLEGLGRGDAPAIEYFTPAGVVLPGQGTQELPERYQALVPGTGDGWIALGPAEDEVVYLTEDFERDGFMPSGNELVSSPERDYVAWTVPMANAPTIYLRSASRPEETMTWELPKGLVVEPVGILGPDSVVYELDPQGEPTVGVANPDGTTTELSYVGASAADPVNGRISVLTRFRGNSSCSGVVEAATRTLAWETCDYRLGTFSPDGTHVMAIAADSDGAGPIMLSVLDAGTGELVAEFSSQGRRAVTLLGPVWETADTIVTSAGEGTTQTLLRLGVDGTLEEATEPVAGSVVEDPYYRLGEDRTVL